MCNLRCAWLKENGDGSICDTPYSSFHPETNKFQIDDIIEIIAKNAWQGDQKTLSHIVISGGEPTMQTESLIDLTSRLHGLGYHITIETNATIFNEELTKYVDLFSMSPKLSSSIPIESHLKNTTVKFNPFWKFQHEKLRKDLEVIQQYIQSCYGYTIDRDTLRSERFVDKDFQLKFVVSTPEDIEEIKNDFLNSLKGWYSEDVILMPEGITREELHEKSKWVVEACIENGWRFTPRLHIDIFGNKVGL